MKLSPNPKITPYVKNMKYRLGTRDVKRRPAMHKSEPQITIMRAPKRSVSRPDIGPKSPVADIANEPTHAERKKNLNLIPLSLSVWMS